MTRGIPEQATALLMLLVLTIASSGASQEAGPGQNKRQKAGFENPRGTFLPGAPERVSLFPDQPELEGRISEESIVRMAYANLEQSVTDSGYGVLLELSDFRTYYESEFQKVLIRDVITLDSPAVLQITETEVGNSESGTVGRSFTPNWEERFSVDELEQLDDWLSGFDDYTIAKSLEAPEISSDHRDLIALTSYLVTVSFEGRVREYRAAFKWVRKGRGAVRFFVEDYVTPGVEQALVGGGRIAPVSVLQNSRLVGEDSGQAVEVRP